MGVEVILDLVHGATGSHALIEGVEITRMAMVTGLDTVLPMGSTDTGLLIITAEEYLASVVGVRGTPCPNVPILTYLDRFVHEVISTGEVRFKIIYKGFIAGQIEFSACLSQVESNVDADGNPIIVEYQYPPDYGAANTVTAGGNIARRSNVPAKQGGMISRPVPELTYTVKLTVPGGLVAVTNIVALEGYTNKSPYPVGVIAGAARTWLVTSVRATSKDGGFTFELSFSIQYREATWDQVVIFINPDDGKPPHDLVLGTGYKKVKVPPEADFPLFVFAPN